MENSWFKHWYDSPQTIQHLFYGVFEGGGAKGIAYNGALQAMRLKRCWFRGVAGASAGAITAALIAAGLTPEEMLTETDRALETVRTGVWDGVLGLHKFSGYFPSDGLRESIEGVLKLSVARYLGKAAEAQVTFEELFEATSIELNVVAADLSLRSLVIFSHLETPACAVADAVIASASIPFAFPSQLLEVPEAHGRVYHHTIVDGGVWSNFPMFVFEDFGFRKYYGREQIDPKQVLGFLLKERERSPIPRGPAIRFAHEIRPKDIRAKESQADNSAQTQGISESRWWARLLYPFALAGRLLGKAETEHGRWPRPNSLLGRYMIDSVNGLLEALCMPFFGAMVSLGIVALTTLAVLFLLVVGAISFRKTLQTSLFFPFQWLILLLGLTSTVSVTLLMAYVTTLALIANVILLRAAKRILYGLATTYVAGPGASVWVEERGNVVALPIPSAVTTLSFEPPPATRRRLIADAQQATIEKLDEILNSDS